MEFGDRYLVASVGTAGTLDAALWQIHVERRRRLAQEPHALGGQSHSWRR